MVKTDSTLLIPEKFESNVLKVTIDLFSRE